MKTASRTLVKSAPEVWEALDHPERMEGLMSALVGHATQVEVYERVEESKLAWKAGNEARIEIQLAEKGWGTNVSVSAENGQEPTMLEGWLDAVLEEIATPQKRPFEGMSETPSGTIVEAMVAKSAADEAPPDDADEAPPDDEPEEPAPEESPAGAPVAAIQEPDPAPTAEETPVPGPPEVPSAPEPARPGFFRRLFGR